MSDAKLRELKGWCQKRESSASNAVARSGGGYMADQDAVGQTTAYGNVIDQIDAMLKGATGEDSR